MEFHRESSSSEASSTDRPQKHSSFLEKGLRHRFTKFRDDNVELSPLERRKGKLEINAEKLPKLQNKFDRCKKLIDMVKQRDGLTFQREFSSLANVLKENSENNNLLETHYLTKSIEKYKEFLNLIKKKEINTNELEDCANSITLYIEDINKDLKHYNWYAKEVLSQYQKMYKENPREKQKDKENFFKSLARKKETPQINNDEDFSSEQTQSINHFNKASQDGQKFIEMYPNSDISDKDKMQILKSVIEAYTSYQACCQSIIAFKLSSANKLFKEFLTKAKDKIEEQVGQLESELDEKSINQNIEELNKAINQGLKDLDLGPSKKKSATMQILKARELQSQLGEDIQKIQDENTGLVEGHRQLLENSRYSTKDAAYIAGMIKSQLEIIREKHGFVSILVHLRTNPAIAENIPIKDQLVQGGLESMKKHWMTLKKDVDAAAVRISERPFERE